MRLFIPNHPPGLVFQCSLHSSSGAFGVTVGGVDVYPSVASDPNDPTLYHLEIPGHLVTCPGPIVIETDGKVALTQTISPCDEPSLHLPRRRTLRGPRHSA